MGWNFHMLFYDIHPQKFVQGIKMGTDLPLAVPIAFKNDFHDWVCYVHRALPCRVQTIPD